MDLPSDLAELAAGFLLPELAFAALGLPPLSFCIPRLSLNAFRRSLGLETFKGLDLGRDRPSAPAVNPQMAIGRSETCLPSRSSNARDGKVPCLQKALPRRQVLVAAAVAEARL